MAWENAPSILSEKQIRELNIITILETAWVENPGRKYTQMLGSLFLGDVDF